MNLDSINVDKETALRLFDADENWLAQQVKVGGFPEPKAIAGKPLWNAMHLYWWWSEHYLRSLRSRIILSTFRTRLAISTGG